MINHSIHQAEVSLNPLAEELLEILWMEEDCYPWNPSDLGNEAYFTSIEQEFSLIDALEDEEIAADAEIFFNHLHQHWVSAETSPVKTSLLQRFGNLVPTAWLDTIIEQAEQMAMDNVSQINRLIGCVKPLWLNCSEDDLEVFARPLAYGMREKVDNEMEEKSNAKEVPWDELSEIGQIRLSLAVAKEVLNQLNTES